MRVRSTKTIRGGFAMGIFAVSLACNAIIQAGSGEKPFCPDFLPAKKQVRYPATSGQKRQKIKAGKCLLPCALKSYKKPVKLSSQYKFPVKQKQFLFVFIKKTVLRLFMRKTG